MLMFIKKKQKIIFIVKKDAVSDNIYSYSLSMNYERQLTLTLKRNNNKLKTYTKYGTVIKLQ